MSRTSSPERARPRVPLALGPHSPKVDTARYDRFRTALMDAREINHE